MPVKKVLIATDGSENSLRAARFAGELLRGRSEVEVTIAFVAGLPPEVQAAFQAVDMGGYHLPIDVPLDQVIRRHAQTVLGATESALDLPQAQVRSEVLVGHPAEEIVTLARSLACDLVVCGRRGISGLRELLMGSVSNRLVHSSPCPVLVVQ